MASESRAARSVLTANVNKLELSPADYGIVTRQGGSFTGIEGQWHVLCAPEDNLLIKWAGVLVCDPGKIEVRLGSDEIMFLLEGAIRVEQEDGNITELGKDDIIVLRRGQGVTIEFTEKCKLFFVTVGE
jgi:uncharacterized cupin superfamily protein